MARQKSAGRVFYLGRLRYRPGIDPPELLRFLEMFDGAEPERKGDILRAALVGGAGPGMEQAAQVEDAETAGVLDNLFSDF